jgi:hypothetical protein
VRAAAAKENDDRARSTLDSDGRRLQRAWRCHHADDTDHDAPTWDDLDPEAQEALRRANRLIGCPPRNRPDGTEDVSGCAWQRCPGSYARAPEAYEVARLLPAFRQGQLAVVRPNVTAVLYDALTIAEGACNAREADDIRRAAKRQPKEPSNG